MNADELDRIRARCAQLSTSAGEPQVEDITAKLARQAERDRCRQLSETPGPYFAERTFATFRPHAGAAAALAVARSIAANPTGPGAGFIGDTGAGKSHLSAAIANAIAPSVGCAFIGAQVLAARLAATRPYNRPTAATVDLLERYSHRVPVLILDDLGLEGLDADFWRDLCSIVNARMEAKLPVIFTSNLSLEQLRAAYAGTKAENHVRRCVDRLSELTAGRIVTVVGTTRERRFAGAYEASKKATA